MATTTSRLRMEAIRPDANVTTLELFFDLVFVFALTQVTALMAGDLSGRGMLRGVLILALLWWSWTGYAWLCNVVRADEGPVRVVLLVAMATMFVAALAIPEAFDDLPGGLPGPVVIAICYFGFRLMHLSLFWIIASGDPVLRRQLVRFTPSVVGGTGLLLMASQFSGTAQTALWAGALLADYGGTLLAGSGGWRLRSAGHFAERHGLILIVALGESIVAIGVGVAAQPISWPIVLGAVTGLVISAALWWVYFDMTSLQAEHALADEPEPTRPRLARDAYSYLHFPMIAGIVMLALGMKKVLEYVSDAEHHTLSDPLSGIALYALYGGIVAFLAAQVAFKWRTVRHPSLDRLLAAAIIAAAIPLAATLPALAALTALAALLVVMVSYETVRYAEHRRDVRHEEHPAG